jgi:hypothetical protein
MILRGRGAVMATFLTKLYIQLYNFTFHFSRSAAPDGKDEHGLYTWIVLQSFPEFPQGPHSVTAAVIYCASRAS